MSREITVCVTNECPFCGKRGFSEGEDSIRLCEKIKCKNCGKKFEVTLTKNVEGTRVAPDENSWIDEMLEIQKKCIYGADKLAKKGLDTISRDLQSVSERIGEVLQLLRSGGEE